MEAEEAKYANAFDDDSDENEASRLDEDLDPEFRDGSNQETLQAFSYDRAFVMNGPIVKVYKNSEEIDEHQHKLKYIMHMDPIKDAQTGRLFEPSNLMLHNNESSMLFIDKHDRNCVVNFDLEKGKVVEKYDTSDKCN